MAASYWSPSSYYTPLPTDRLLPTAYRLSTDGLALAFDSGPPMCGRLLLIAYYWPPTTLLAATYPWPLSTGLLQQAADLLTAYGWLCTADRPLSLAFQSQRHVRSEHTGAQSR